MAAPNSVTTIHPSNLATNQAIRLLFVATGVSIGATGDSTVTLPAQNVSTYAVTNVILTNANKDISAGALAIWTGVNGTGTEIVTNATLTSQTTAAYVKAATVVAGTLTTALTAQTVYVKVGTAVAGGTVDIYVYGYDLSVYS